MNTSTSFEKNKFNFVAQRHDTLLMNETRKFLKKTFLSDSYAETSRLKYDFISYRSKKD